VKTKEVLVLTIFFITTISFHGVVLSLSLYIYIYIYIYIEFVTFLLTIIIIRLIMVIHNVALLN
jgi:hypothetical protein